MTPRQPPDAHRGKDLFRSQEGTHHDAVARLVDRLAEDPVPLVDVRSREAYEAGHVQGAFHVPAGSENEHVDALPRDALIYVYGQDATAPDAGEVAFLLGQAGVPTQEVPGGFEALQELGAPIQAGPNPGTP